MTRTFLSALLWSGLGGVAGLAGACSPWSYTVPNEPGGPGPSGQTYKGAVELMCNVDRLAELDPAEPDELADVKRFSYLEQHVDNPDGIYLRTFLSVNFGEDRECLLRDAQNEVGLAQCPLADKALAEVAPPSQ